MTPEIPAYRGDDQLIAGIVLAVITFWLFAQTTLNVLPAMRADLQISDDISDIAVSITALFSGVLIVVAGVLADRFGRVRVTKVGLAFSIVGSLFIAASPRNTAVFLITGRIVQGVSAACIMPATLALMKTYYEGAQRQRALSFWSIGGWGGGGLCALLGGAVDTTLGWRSIFWISIVVALVSWLLIQKTPESRANDHDDAHDDAHRLDWTGLVSLLIGMLAFNVVVGRGSTLGWFSPIVLVLMATTVIALWGFVRIEQRCCNPFVDFGLFQNTVFLAATLSNFLVNGVAGSLLVVSLLLQRSHGLSSLQSGLVTVGYLIAILTTIRIGEKMQQRSGGPRRPMMLGCVVTCAGVLLTTFTWMPAMRYVGTAFIGFTLIGVGQGVYATPSTDAALSDVLDARAGEAAGIYKMASSLGTAFGVAVSAAIFTTLQTANRFDFMSIGIAGHPDPLRFAAAVALAFNLALAVLAAVTIQLGVPKRASVDVPVLTSGP